MTTENCFHLIAGTHWDREWLYPFEYSQSMLVDMMDDLLDFLEGNPDYRHFHLDGQTVIVEDYLRIRPENRDRLIALVKQDRLLIGPYYSLLDESHVIGESIVRNLSMGHKLAQSFGGRMDVGYSPAGFGKVSQLPQILQSVGLDTVIFYRGLRQDRSNLEFIWRSPDGTEVLGLRLTGPLGRAWYFAKIAVPVAYPDGVLQDGLFAVHNDLSKAHGLEGGFIAPAGYATRFREADIANGLAEMEAVLSADTVSDQLLAMHAIDYGGTEKTTARIVEEINRMAGREKIKFSTIPAFVDAFRKSLVGHNLTLLEGEFRQSRRETRDLTVCTSVASSGGVLKAPNRRAELALSRWAEVWDTFVYALTGKSSSVLLESAWKDLLASHAHDSVTGQGTDQVIDNVLNRFERIQQTANGVTDYALCRLAKLIRMPDAPPSSIFLTVFNPSSVKRNEVLKINVDMPFYEPDADGNTDLAEIWSEADIDSDRLIDTTKKKPRITDDSGNPVDFAIVDIRPLEPIGISHPGWGGRRLCAHRYVIWLQPGDVPALGYKTLIASMVDAAEEEAKELISSQPNCLENEFLKVRVHSNGTLDVTNKQTGRIFSGGLLFEDGREFGTSLHARCQDTVRFTNECATVTLLENTHLSASFEISLVLRIPSGAGKGVACSADTLELPISSVVTLKKGSRRLDIITRLENRARNHRLRVLFPTGLETEWAWADQPFDIIRRPIMPDSNAPDSLEPPCATQPCISFVDLNDGAEGLAVLTLGMIEYEVTDDPDRAIALTLLRCFQDSNKNCGELDFALKRTQNLGEFVFNYAIYPHAGNVEQAAVQQASESHMLPLKVLQSGRASGGTLKDTLGFIEFGDEDVCLSAVKKSDRGGSIIIRVYNPTARNIDTTMRLWTPVEAVRVVDSLERPLSVLAVGGTECPLRLGHKKILSLEVVLP